MESFATEPRWLDEGEQETWQALVGVLIRLPAALDAQLRRDAGITHFEYQVLAGLSAAADRTMRISELAGVTEGSLPRVSQVVRKLEARGWVRRSADQADGRCTLATLTRPGLAKLTQIAPGHVAEVRRLVFDQLSGVQARQVREAGRRILRAVEASRPYLADGGEAPAGLVTQPKVAS